MPLKVGELARRSGVSVRTLHHYDEIGLLSPSARTESGHRLYTEADILRLQQVISLRSLGFPLDDIRTVLNDPSSSPMKILEMHLTKLQKELEEQTRLIDNVEKIALGLRMGQNPSTDQILQLIEEIKMHEKYYTKDQLNQLKSRANALGEDAIRQAEKDWTQLIQEVRALMESGSDPADVAVQALAKRWSDLLSMFTGGDANIARSLGTMYQQEGSAQASRGMLDEATMKYINEANKIANRDRE